MGIVTNNLVGYWHYKRGVDTTHFKWANIAPATKGQYDGTISTASSDPIITEKGVYFNGTNTFMEVGNFLSTVDAPTIQIGFIHEKVWNGTTNSALVSSSNGHDVLLLDTAEQTIAGTDPNAYSLALATQTNKYNTNTPIQQDERYTITVTKNSSGYVYYINGGVEPVYTSSSAVLNLSGILSIGRDFIGMNEYFKGYIQFVRVYNSSLTSSDVVQNFNVGYEDTGLTQDTTTGKTIVPVAPVNFRKLHNYPLDVYFAWEYSTDAYQYTLKRDGNIVYQGEDDLFDDTAVEPQTTYTYTLTATNEIGDSTTVSTTVTTPVLTMQYVPIGAKIKMGVQEFSGKRVDGTEDITWQVVSQNHWKTDVNYPDNATTLITEKAIRMQAFDVDGNASTITPQTQKYGSQKWWASNIRQWLNSDDSTGQWFTAKYNGDLAPKTEYMTVAPVNYFNYGYDTDAGFMSYFTDIEKSILRPTNITALANHGDMSEWGESEWWTNDFFYLIGAEEFSSVADFDAYTNKDGYILEGFYPNTSSNLDYQVDAIVNYDAVLASDLAWANYSSLTQPSTGVKLYTRSDRAYDYVDNGTMSTKIWDSNTGSQTVNTGGWTTTVTTIDTTLPKGIRPLCNVDNSTFMAKELDNNGVWTGNFVVASSQQYTHRYPSTTTISELPLNVLVKMGTNSFNDGKRVTGSERIYWRILSNNHWLKDGNYPVNGVTIMSDRIIRYMAWSSTDIPDGYQYGTDTWIFSTIADWLNSSAKAGAWFTSGSTTPNPPDYDHILHSNNGTDWLNEPYDKDDGFLTFFTDKELTAIITSDVKTIMYDYPNPTRGDVYIGQENGFKFFLPSYREVVGQEYGNFVDDDGYYVTEGRMFNIDDRMNTLDALDTDLAFYNSPYWNTPEKRNDRKKTWWRTFDINNDTSTTKKVVNGATFNDYTNTSTFFATLDYSALAYGIRPVCNLDGNTQVHLAEFLNGVPVYEIEDSSTIDSTGYEWSDTQPEVNPPIIPPDTQAPSEVGTVSTTVTTNSITINWTNPTEVDFDHVNIYKNGMSLVTGVKDTTYTLNNLIEGEMITFKITTVDLAGNESTGITFTATTATVDRTPPNDVTNLVETHTDSSVTISWTNPSDSDFAYTKVYQNNTLVFDNYHSTTALLVSIPPSTKQTFKVTTVDLNGNESNGTSITATTNASGTTDDVTNLIATAGYTTVTLYWDKSISTNYNHARIYLNGGSSPVLDNITAMNATVGGLNADTQYTFLVVAVDANGDASDGVTIIVNTIPNPDSTAPSEITGLAETHTDVTATLTWTNPTDSDFVYAKVYYKNILVKDNVTSGSVTISGLYNNYDYTFKVCTVDKTGNISAGSTITLTTNDSSTGTYKTIGDLPVGGRLKMGTSNFESGSESIYWTVISKKHYKKDSGYVEGVTFITDKNIKYTAFDTLSRTDYSKSEIAYWMQMGFMNGFGSVEKNTMLSTTVEFNGETLVAKAFLPSTAEIQDSFVNAQNGVLFQYFEDNPTFKYVDSQQMAFDNANLNGTVDTLQTYWLRDADGTKNRYITTDDSTRVNEALSPSEIHGIRPITNLNSTTLIEAVTNETGVFQIQGSTSLPTTLPNPNGGQIKVGKDNTCLIHVLNPSDLSIDGIVDNYESATMTVNYNSVGDFMIMINNRLANAMLFVKQKYVVFNGDGKFAGVITNIQIDLDEDGNEIRTIKGKTLGHLLSYRVIAMDSSLKTSDNYSGLGEKAIKYYVRRNTNQSPIDTDKRSLPNFVVADDKNLGQNIARQYFYDNLLDVVDEISQLQDLGYEIYYDISSNTIIFDVYVGTDYSVDQSDNPPIMLSANIGNLESQSYIYDENTDANYAYVNGNDDEVLNPDNTSTTDTVIQINKDNVSGQISSGITRKEIFYKIDTMEKGYFVPSDVLGQEKLTAQAELETFEVKVMDNQMFTYGVDYKLGDTVTIYNESWSVTADLQIVAVTLNMSSSKEYDIELTFGDVLPTLTDKIERTVESYDPNKYTQW